VCPTPVKLTRGAALKVGSSQIVARFVYLDEHLKDNEYPKGREYSRSPMHISS